MIMRAERRINLAIALSASSFMAFSLIEIEEVDIDVAIGKLADADIVSEASADLIRVRHLFTNEHDVLS